MLGFFLCHAHRFLSLNPGLSSLAKLARNIPGSSCVHTPPQADVTDVHHYAQLFYPATVAGTQVLMLVQQARHLLSHLLSCSLTSLGWFGGSGLRCPSQGWVLQILCPPASVSLSRPCLDSKQTVKRHLTGREQGDEMYKSP